MARITLLPATSHPSPQLFSGNPGPQFRRLYEDYGGLYRKGAGIFSNQNSVDFRDFFYVIPAAEQEWTRELMRNKIPFQGTRRMAVIQGIDFLPQLSVEQTIPENNRTLNRIAYFQDEKETFFLLTSPS